MPVPDDPPSGSERLTALDEKLEMTLGRLEEARPFAKLKFQQPVIDVARRILAEPGGVAVLYAQAPRFDGAGLFQGTDWEKPSTLLPGMVRNTFLGGQAQSVVLECLSQLRLLAVANGNYRQPEVSPEHAKHHLTQILALNLAWVFGGRDEATRERLGDLADSVSAQLNYLLEHIGIGSILGALVEEIWRVLAQRPIQVDHVKAMIAQISISLAARGGDLGDTRIGADRLVTALFGPTNGCSDDPGLDGYRQRLAAMDDHALLGEAQAFARAMHDTGLVSDYHPVLLRWLLESGHRRLIPDALGLSSTGLDAFRCFEGLILKLIEDAIHPPTAQSIYGLAMLLERGLLYAAPIGPALWRQIAVVPSPEVEATLAAAYGPALPPRVWLLAGVISVLGQPLGVGQGNNPTCQSARAISLWSYNDPDYLLFLIANAARYGYVVSHFEGQAISSANLAPGLTSSAPLDTDAVSLVLVPHLDRIYGEMGRLCASRGEDPHRWINPEFHGWWVGRDFAIAVDIATGKLSGYREFLHQFYASYHPLHNGNQPVIHPQPAGIAVTDSSARFVGWHAISILRVALDQHGTMRVYFYNPNNDSGQDLGKGIVVSTEGNGERHGEASLPFPEFASRLYIFHDEPLGETTEPLPSEEEIDSIERMALESWAAEKQYSPPAAAEAEAE